MARSVLAVALVALLAGCASAKLHGVTYNPFSKSSKQQCLESKELDSHLKGIAKTAENIRLYSLTICPDNTRAIMKFAAKNDLGVMVGMHLTKSTMNNNKEFKMLEMLVKKYADNIVSIVVGNELVYISKMKTAKVVGYILKAKAIVKKAKADIMVSTAESWPYLEFNKSAKKITAAADFVCMNMQPYWEGIAADSEPGVMVNSKADVLENIHKKEVAICGAGWPTMGEKCCNGRPRTLDGRMSVPGEKAQSNFLADLDKAATKSDRMYFVTEAIDGEWRRTWAPCDDCVGLTKDFGCKNKKKPECEVEYHFGFMTYSGKTKPGIKIP
ncbi:hypothetical protein BSKO_05654 [Bryopsis sp. KO-2023]|nr:hypothetical protein BSKO_05654 [Bryopsis sp. KO-2023]